MSPPSKKAAPPARKPRPPSPLREAQKELAKQRLIEAALSRFETSGYAEVTVDDIVQTAGTSRGTFYLYFQSKGEILRAIIDRLATEVRAAGLFDDFRTMKPTIPALEAWFGKYVDFYGEHRQLWGAMHQAIVVEPELATVVPSSIGQYVTLWKSCGFLPHASDEDLRLAATMLYTLSDQFMYLWLTQSTEIDRKRATRAMAEAFAATLKR